MAAQGYLIDTHCWLCWHIEPERLDQPVLHLIEDGATEIFFSVVSAWEITIKYGLNKLTLPLPPEKYIPSRLRRSYMEILPIELEHTLGVGKLPDHHRDPFDRLLIAQALSEKLTIITQNSQFNSYDVELFH